MTYRFVLAAALALSPVSAFAQATTDIILTTEKGDIVIALETERAPITAANFLRYVDEKRLDGTVFYRSMQLSKDKPDGLIQGGTQFDPERILPPIAHERTSATGVKHTAGAISMARYEPGTATGDFSIMVTPQHGLDANPASEDETFREGYAAFGHVVQGMDVVLAIYNAPLDPDKGEGWMKGQMIAEPVKIISARRVEAATQ
ncbi:peptidylprolyl isomerase [Croceibacterium sp. LX-88]|jgi:peptidyl-prolyl cis-trans isomerase A (cyclophilin A)|uniref:peptidylprolyl isomerase n=1 Tax=Croceibacterium selenioxidans TaxID=2838833 RepID=A0ABS5W1A4_9SPHN|nr:peptidylprolyl isomerase [Croceibacterium selenioxidans]MBT2133538.1 peptidylprolyl isomerase [Croceibacterium selenioxidans]